LIDNIKEFDAITKQLMKYLIEFRNGQANNLVEICKFIKKFFYFFKFFFTLVEEAVNNLDWFWETFFDCNANIENFNNLIRLEVP